jgi:hypothetical protein
MPYSATYWSKLVFERTTRTNEFVSTQIALEVIQDEIVSLEGELNCVDQLFFLVRQVWKDLQGTDFKTIDYKIEVDQETGFIESISQTCNGRDSAKSLPMPLTSINLSINQQSILLALHQSTPEQFQEFFSNTGEFSMSLAEV